MCFVLFDLHACATLWIMEVLLIHEVILPVGPETFIPGPKKDHDKL